jgi:hypothetical protein
MPVKKGVKKTKLSTAKTVRPFEFKSAEDMPETVGTTSIKNQFKQPKVIVGLVVIVLIVAAFFLKGFFIAAVVNGEPISRFQVISDLEKQGGKQALSSLVNQALILQEARKKGIVATQSELDKATKQIEDSLKKQGQDLNTALAAQGMSRADLTLQLKLRTLVEKLLADKVKVSDKEISDYITANKASFPTSMTEADLRKSVAEQLKQQKLGSSSQTWLADLTKNAKINYFVNY